jgi:Carbohydrate-selective porin, OprB family
VGAGELHTRIIAAFGRISPNGVGVNSGSNQTSFNGYSRIAGDALSSNQGISASSLPGLSGGTNVRSLLYVEDLHYHQHFKSGIPLLTDWMVGDKKNAKFATTGDFYVGSMPWRYLFDKSPYRGNELNQFQNPAFVNTPGIAVNQNMPMVAYQWHQKLGTDSLSLDATAAAGAVDVSDALSGLNATYEGRLNYKIGSLPGNLYGGGYNVWSSGNSDPTNVTGALSGTANSINTVNRSGIATNLTTSGHKAFQGLYGGWSQEWFRGIGTTFNYMLSQGGQWNYYLNSYNQTLGASNATVASLGTGNTNVVVAPRTSWTGVLNIPLSAFGNFRRNDVIGIGYSMLTLRQNGISQSTQGSTRFSNGIEHTGEAYYKFAINDSISIIPSMQWIDHGLGIKANGPVWVAGLRTSFSF